MPDLLHLDSITDIPQRHDGQVTVSGSHGGLYPALVAAQAGLSAVIFNDAGIGLDEAGVAGLALLDDLGMPAAAVDCASARIGDAADMGRRGVVSRVNTAAAAFGCRVGDTCATCAAKLAAASARPRSVLPALSDGRRLLPLPFANPKAWGLDSASLIRPEDAETIIVTGSHGGLVGGNPARALAVHALAAAFNDAGVGIDKAGIARIAVLDDADVPAVAVSHLSARIGDALSSWETGIISFANAAARSSGAAEGQLLQDFVMGVARTASPGRLGKWEKRI